MSGMSVEPGLLDHPWLKGILRGAGTAVANRNPSRVLTVLEVLCMEVTTSLVIFTLFPNLQQSLFKQKRLSIKPSGMYLGEN